MNGALKAKLKDKNYRDTYIAETLKTALASQIAAMRAKERWTQAELARRVGTTQNVISRLEDPDYGKFSLQTLLDLASAFEVALLAKFVSVERFVNEFEDVSSEALAVPSFAEETVAVRATKPLADSDPKNTFSAATKTNVAANYDQAAYADAA